MERQQCNSFANRTLLTVVLVAVEIGGGRVGRLILSLLLLLFLFSIALSFRIRSVDPLVRHCALNCMITHLR
ncbi:hypothetical protein IWX90DRAFT_424327 [Phyllosticta citrichinensis]|uniref:Uncharacterized protein n=1 Tax=Phyllosticta citrichinensis TaxID=1130410 RepID=A0ABR1Y3H9_9PEZI